MHHHIRPQNKNWGPEEAASYYCRSDSTCDNRITCVASRCLAVNDVGDCVQFPCEFVHEGSGCVPVDTNHLHVVN